MNNLIKTQSKLAKIVVFASFFALGGTALAQQATAAAVPPANSQSTTHWSVEYPVGFSDLDVSKISGARILYMRIRFAAEVLCQSNATWGKKEGAACLHKAVNDAAARVNAPLLTQYSRLRSKVTCPAFAGPVRT